MHANALIRLWLPICSAILFRILSCFLDDLAAFDFSLKPGSSKSCMLQLKKLAFANKSMYSRTPAKSAKWRCSTYLLACLLVHVILRTSEFAVYRCRRLHGDSIVQVFVLVSVWSHGRTRPRICKVLHHIQPCAICTQAHML